MHSNFQGGSKEQDQSPRPHTTSLTALQAVPGSSPYVPALLLKPSSHGLWCHGGRVPETELQTQVVSPFPLVPPAAGVAHCLSVAFSSKDVLWSGLKHHENNCPGSEDTCAKLQDYPEAAQGVSQVVAGSASRCLKGLPLLVQLPRGRGGMTATCSQAALLGYGALTQHSGCQGPLDWCAALVRKERLDLNTANLVYNVYCSFPC